MKSKKRYPKGRMARCNISNRRCFLLTGAGRTPTLIERYSYGSYGLPGGRTVLDAGCWRLRPCSEPCPDVPKSAHGGFKRITALTSKGPPVAVRLRAGLPCPARAQRKHAPPKIGPQQRAEMSMSRLFGSPWSSVLREVLLHAKRVAACPIRPLLTGAMLAARLSGWALRMALLG